MRQRFRTIAAAATLWAVAAANCGAAPRGIAATDPVWLRLVPGTGARVDVAPWLNADEPEAALTASAASMERDFSANGERPDDVLYRPIGVRAVLVRVLADRGVALVRGRAGHWQGFARIDRLVPEIPPGTALRAAGGFAGFADFFASVETPYRAATRLPTGSELTALRSGAAPYDPDTSNLVRVQVRVRSGPLRGKIGWIAAAYAGLPATRLPVEAEVAEKACRCRLVQFDSAILAPITKR